MMTTVGSAVTLGGGEAEGCVSRRALNERCEIVHLGAVRDARGVGVLELVPGWGPGSLVRRGRLRRRPGVPRRFCRSGRANHEDDAGGPGAIARASHSRRASSFFFATTMSASVLCRGSAGDTCRCRGRGGGREGRARAFGYRDETSSGPPRTGSCLVARVPRRAGGSRELTPPRASNPRVSPGTADSGSGWRVSAPALSEQRHRVRAPRCRRRRPLRGPVAAGEFPDVPSRPRRANSRPRPAPRALGGGGAGWDDD